MHSFIERSLVGIAYAAVWVTSLVYSPNLGYPILLFVIAFVAAFEMLKLYQIRSLALTTLLCFGTASLLVFNAPLLQIAILSFFSQLGLAILLFRRKTIQAHPLLASLLCIAHLLFPLLVISEVSFVESPVFTIELTLDFYFLSGGQMQWPTVLELFLEKHHFFGLCRQKNRLKVPLQQFYSALL